MAENCPICSEPLHRFEEEVAIRCINQGCPAIVLQSITHFGSRKALDIAGLGPERGLERAYYQGMGAVLAVEDRGERIARRELYRHGARIGEMVIDVAERVVYAIVKQS